MVLYSLEDVNVLLSPIQKIHGRPTFRSLWHLAQKFYDALRKLDHADHPTDGWSTVRMIGISNVAFNAITMTS